ncbi:uncharacterized protein E0L32_004017 [Thyridium curvatum]|uniref:Uncharacterized protein n=1 Tax=Thyridium curvatum TaxID=1093900 RepID=A0A507BI65_9PEZI|nr:uncharacterized protein E0L32_004017 [Thyridium curvatum]TPX16368.1 hypothetical protein E0L32_004017 [Thyridium curvatum]
MPNKQYNLPFSSPAGPGQKSNQEPQAKPAKDDGSKKWAEEKAQACFDLGQCDDQKFLAEIEKLERLAADQAKQYHEDVEAEEAGKEKELMHSHSAAQTEREANCAPSHRMSILPPTFCGLSTFRALQLLLCEMIDHQPEIQSRNTRASANQIVPAQTQTRDLPH